MTSSVTTSQLANVIPSTIKDDKSGRVALYHFIKSTCRGSEPVTNEFINDFFTECLLYSFWQEKKAELSKDIKDLLGQFNLGSDQIWDLSRIQLVNLTQAENLYTVVKSFEAHQSKEGESFRVIPDGESRMVVLRKSNYGLLNVKTYSNLVRIQGKELIPVKNDQELTYTPNLELQMGRVHKLRLSLHSQARFEITENSIITQVLTGFAFRQNQMLQLTHLNELTPLFFQLKKLEKFYVYRPSDPFYVGIVQSLDSAMEKIKAQAVTGAPGAHQEARKIFEEAQIAFDQVFPDDKILFMKLKELARLMSFNPKDLTV